jgi:hypothetical protein
MVGVSIGTYFCLGSIRERRGEERRGEERRGEERRGDFH